MKLRALDPILYPDRDMLHKDFIEHLYYLITESIQPPYAISIDGLWGTGKTIIMKTLESKLRERSYPVFWFNPWEYRQSDNVVAAFLRRLATEYKSFLDAIGTIHGRTILAVLAETTMDVGLSMLTDGKVSLKGVKESFESAEGKPKFSFTDYDDIVETIKKEFIELIDRISEQNEKKPVIIFFDDLDRCLPDDAVKLLEALKNLFVTRVGEKKCNAIFVCGIDTHIAKQFIQAHYKDISANFAINYFRKIFNLTIAMPQSFDIEKVLLKYLNDSEVSKLLTPQQAQALAKMICSRGFQFRLYSVRKYLNVITNFCVFLEFNPNYKFTPEQFEPADDFVVNLLMLQEFWQPLYEHLRQEAIRTRAAMGELVQGLLTQKAAELSRGEREFLTNYLGTNSPFKKELLSSWLANYPTLA
jgi:hypothetical protein